MKKETWESAYRTLKFQLDLSAEEETYLNDFVRILLASQKEKMLGVLEGMDNEEFKNDAMGYGKGYLTALSDIKKNIGEL